MTIEKVLKIFNRFGGVNRKVWTLQGTDDNWTLIDSNAKEPKWKEWMLKSVAEKWKEKNITSAVNTAPRDIVLSADEDDDSVFAYCVLNSNNEIESWCKRTAEGTYSIANLPVGTYKVIAISNDGEALRTETLTIVEPPVEPIEE